MLKFCDGEKFFMTKNEVDWIEFVYDNRYLFYLYIDYSKYAGLTHFTLKLKAVFGNSFYEFEEYPDAVETGLILSKIEQKYPEAFVYTNIALGKQTDKKSVENFIQKNKIILNKNCETLVEEFNDWERFYREEKKTNSNFYEEVA